MKRRRNKIPFFIHRITIYVDGNIGRNVDRQVYGQFHKKHVNIAVFRHFDIRQYIALVM